MTPEQTAAVAIVAEKLLGCECVVIQGFTVLRNDNGMDREFDPFKSATNDYEVLEAVREKWSGEQLYSFIERLKGIRWARSEVTLSYSLEVMHHQPGDYCRAAAEVLKGDAP